MATNAERIAERIRQHKKIEAIQLLRETTGLDLAEAKEEIERLSDEMKGAAAAAKVGSNAAPPSSSPPLPEEVLSLARSGRKIEAIKLLRETSGLGLKESKDLVDAATGGKSGGCVSVLVVLLAVALGWIFF